MEECGAEQQINLLIDVLKQEVQLLEQIKTVEVEKNFYLTTHKKMVDLTPQNELLETLLIKEAHLEQSREAFLNELSLHYQEDPLTLQDIINKIPSEQKDELRIVRDSLQQLLSEIKEMNEVNKIVLSDLIKLVGYTLDLYTQERNLEIDYGHQEARSKRSQSLVVNMVI